MATTMAKKQTGTGRGRPRRSDGGQHKTPRVHVPLKKRVVDPFREWCRENRLTLAWEIEALMEEKLRSLGREVPPATQDPKEGGGA